MPIYNAITQENDSDLTILENNHYGLQVAKSVASGDKAPDFTMVYQSHILTYSMDVQWTITYGMNFCTDIPSPGLTVTYGGRWTECALGDSYDLNTIGKWIPNQNNPAADPNSVNVGKNGFQTPVYIIVGVKSDDGSYLPIWTGKDSLLVNSSGQYQPHESVKIWYEEGTLSSTMITDQKTVAVEYDMTDDHTSYFYFDAVNGKWAIPQPTPFPINAKPVKK